MTVFHYEPQQPRKQYLHAARLEYVWFVADKDNRLPVLLWHDPMDQRQPVAADLLAHGHKIWYRITIIQLFAMDVTGFCYP